MRRGIRVLIALGLLTTTLVSAAGEGRRALTAVMDDDVTAFKKLLRDELWEVDEIGVGGTTALIQSCHSGSLKMIEYLLSRGADIEAVDGSGYNCIHGAATNGQLEVLQLLWQLSDSANKHSKLAMPKKEQIRRMMHEQHRDGFAPYHRACWGARSEHTETVRWFLDVVRVPLVLRSNNTHQADCSMLAGGSVQNQETLVLLRERFAPMKAELEERIKQAEAEAKAKSEDGTLPPKVQKEEPAQKKQTEAESASGKGEKKKKKKRKKRRKKKGSKNKKQKKDL